MKGLLYIPLESNALTISLKWTALVTAFETGGESILSYNLEWDEGTSGATWSDVQGQETIPSLATSALITTNHLVFGTQYQFRVRALNIHGWSVRSDVLNVVHSDVTSKPDAPTTILQNLFVKISWNEPAQLNAAAILAYKIVIADTNGNFIEDTVNCNGQQDQILQQRFCLIPMTRLRLDPYLLTFQQMIRAKVSVLNRNGWSAESDANTVGALIQVEPQTMPAPTKGALTSQTQVHVLWTSTDFTPMNGDSTILTYNL